MKGAKGYDESTDGESSSLGFYELFGMKASYLEVQIAAKLVRGLLKQIEPHYHDGEVTSLTISAIPKEKDEELEILLNQMKIYPWIEEVADGTSTFSIDNAREVQRLTFFMPLQDQVIEAVPTPKEGAGIEETESVTPDPYAFPSQPIPEDPNPKIIYRPTPKIERSTISDEVPETDLWMETARDNFDQGLPLEDEEDVEIFNKKGPDLRLFKNRYQFYKDSIKAPSGELLSRDDHKEVLLAAKHDPEKMAQAVDMSVGLVKMVVDRLMKKFSTNEIYDEDDLFQAGMEGLLYGLGNLEERETSPSSYLVPCIEGYIRKVIRTQKRIFTQPEGSADTLAKYRRAQAELEKQIPRFHSLTRTQQEEKIIERAGFSRLEARTVLKIVNAKREVFDEESIEPEFTHKDKSLIEAGSDEHERVGQTFDRALETLSVREEIIVRLHFGLVGGSRVKNITDVKDIFSQIESFHIKPKVLERLQRLYAFDLAKDDFDSLNRAEQMFVALLGKVPESFVSHLHNDNPFNPTDLTLEDIGAIFSITRERVREILAKAIRNMRHPARMKPLRDSGYLAEESRKSRWSDRPYNVTSIDEREIT